MKYALIEGKGSVAVGLEQHSPQSVRENGGYFEAEPKDVKGLLDAGVIEEWKAPAKALDMAPQAKAAKEVDDDPLHGEPAKDGDEPEKDHVEMVRPMPTPPKATPRPKA